jgi:hypothetical protein
MFVKLAGFTDREMMEGGYGTYDIDSILRGVRPYFRGKMLLTETRLTCQRSGRCVGRFTHSQWAEITKKLPQVRGDIAAPFAE